MNCKHCQAELEAEATVCPICGKDQTEEAAPEALEETAPVETAETACEETVQEAAGEIPESAEETEEAEEGAPEEAAEAQPEEAPRKSWKKAVMIAAMAVLAVVLAAAVWFGVNGGLQPKENNIHCKDSYYAQQSQVERASGTVVATTGNRELTNAELQIYYWMQFYEFLDYYGDYVMYFGLDYTSPMDTQNFQDGMSWQQYFLTVALDYWHQYNALYQVAQAEGFVMPEQMQNQLDFLPEQMENVALEQGFDTLEQMLQREMGEGAKVDAYMRYLETYYYGNSYMDAKYAELSVTDEEVEAFFAANESVYAEQGLTKQTASIDVRHILITPEGGTTDENGKTVYSDEEWEACRQKAQQILDEYLAGPKTQDDFAYLANTHSTDPGSNTNGGLYTDVLEGQMVPEFNDWCFDKSRAFGDTGLVKTTYGYHIMYFVDSRTLWFDQAKSDLMADTVNRIVDDAVASMDLEVKFKKICIGDLPRG